MSQVTLSDEVEALVATGTSGLAYAALVQAVSAEKQRRWSVQPVPMLSIEGGPVSHRLTGGELFSTTGDPSDLPPIRVTNAGQGHAIGLRAHVYIWTDERHDLKDVPNGLPWIDRLPQYDDDVLDWQVLPPSGYQDVPITAKLTGAGMWFALPAYIRNASSRDNISAQAAVQMVVTTQCYSSAYSEIGLLGDACGFFIEKAGIRYGSNPSGAVWKLMTRDQLVSLREIPEVKLIWR